LIKIENIKNSLGKIIRFENIDSKMVKMVTSQLKEDFQYQRWID
jgi:hypothetical protein